MKRLSRSRYYMGMAYLSSMRGTCDRKLVGCVVVKDGRIISTGYAGSPPDMPHCTDVGCEIVNGHCIRTTHAEANALIFAARHGIKTEGSYLYCTLSPCYNCAKLIISAGIKHLSYAEEYPDTSGLKLLREAEIVCFQLKENYNDISMFFKSLQRSIKQKR